MAGRQRGAASVELSLLIPVLMILLLTMAGAWRIGNARAQVSEAAAAGARAATIPTSAARAAGVANQVIAADLATVGAHCTSLAVDVDTSAFGNPVGTPGDVTTTVSCRLNLSDVVVPGMPGAMTITASAQEPIDTFRERTP